MSTVLNDYSYFNQLNNQGTVKRKRIDEAESFLREYFLNSRTNSALGKLHLDIQSSLFNLKKTEVIAEVCLRCYVSEQIKQTCKALARQFGENYQFEDSDLYGFVLDDFLTKDKKGQFLSINQSQTQQYVSLTHKVLKTFEPSRQYSLSTWVSRLTKSHGELTKFLKGQGLCFISNWGILNNTKPKQLKRILSEFHNLSRTQIDLAQKLLKAYHQVYLNDRQKQILSEGSQARGRKCSPPSQEQLQRMTQLVKLSLTKEELLIELENIAGLLKQYSQQKTRTNQISFDNPDTHFQVEQQQVRDSESSLEKDDNEFLTFYRQQFLKSLENAVSVVVCRRQNKIKEAKKSSFINALQAYHCQGLSMTTIAYNIGLKQYEVTRLLKLKDLRSDIQQEMLNTLTKQIKSLATTYTNADELLKREEQIAIALEEQTATLIEEASSEERQKRNEPFKNILAQYICNYLDLQETI